MGRRFEVISALLLLGIVAYLGPAGPTTAEAILFDRGTTTLDPHTGLVWLDLTESVSISYNSMQSKFGPGQQFDGYRHASEAEALQLFRDAGMTGVPFYQASKSAFEWAKIVAFQDLVGVTNEAGCCGFERPVSNGISSTPWPGGTMVVPFVERIDYADDAFDVASATSSTIHPDAALPGAGHWLVQTGILPGCKQAAPVMPDSSEDDKFSFVDADGLGLWFDPIGAEGFSYEVTDGVSKFTMVGLPTGIGDSDNSFTVTDAENGARVAAGGEFLEFAVPVDSFTITGIDPTVDGSNETAFPTFLLFDTEVVSFTMTPLGGVVTTSTTTSTVSIPSSSSTTTTGLVLGDCGVVVTGGDKPLASDCLGILQHAVAKTGCAPLDACICDVDASGQILASDALLCLNVAVGNPAFSLACACL